jgi:hypothetical protein
MSWRTLLESSAGKNALGKRSQYSSVSDKNQFPAARFFTLTAWIARRIIVASFEEQSLLSDLQHYGSPTIAFARPKKSSQLAYVTLTLGCLLCYAGLSAAQTFAISPPSLTFGSQTVGTFRQSTVTLLNTGKTNLTLNSFSLSPPEFQLVNGYAPAVLGPERSMYFTIIFVPDLAQTFNGQLTINIQGVAPQVVPLSGGGTATGAAATLGTTAMNFGRVTQGSTSAAQTLVVTNSGTSSFRVLTANADPPFAVNGFVPTAVSPGASLNLPITMSGTIAGAYPGEVTLTFDVLPVKAVTLNGNVVAAKTFTGTSFPTLPTASTGEPYLADLQATGGTAPYSWALAAGSSLPSGLTLTGTGSISGNIASSQAIGSYSFSVQVNDSSAPPNAATAALALPVATAPPLPDCNNIVYPNVATALVPLNDLATGIYFGEEGGLYPNGSNQRPSAQDAAGVKIAQAIQPLDANGNPDSNGKYVMISIGNSEAQQEFLQFFQDAAADPATNPHLVIVNGAQDALVASDWADINTGAWPTLTGILLPQAGVTANQVVAAWIKTFDIPSGAFPGNEAATQANLESIAQNLHTLFPNIKLAYYASRIYGGYANDADGSTQDGEPNSYQTSFAVKWAIQDQINGVASLNFDPTKGPVMAPWMSWEAYDWANGMLPRSDGLVWTCQDFLDGGHPSIPWGREKDANLFLSFLKTDDSSRLWYLNPAQLVLLSSTSLSFGNQAIGTTSKAQTVTLTNNQALPLKFSSIVASGDFAQTNNCGSSLAAGGSCTISVKFTPSISGSITGAVTVVSNVANSPELIQLSGKGVYPLTVIPASASFGTVAVGKSSTEKTLTVINHLAQAVSLNIAASGEFSATGSGTNACGSTLAANAQCTLSATFAPTTNGAITGAVTLGYNGAFSPQLVILSGTGSGGSAAPLSFSPASGGFGKVGVGTTSSKVKIQITNTSSVAVNITSVIASGMFAATSGSPACSGNLNAGASCYAILTFSPPTPGTIAGSLTITDNSSVSTQVMKLTGTAILPVTLLPASLAFANQDVGTISAAQVVTITNNGASAVALSTPQASGDFLITTAGANPCGTSLPALTSCTLGLEFNPSITGAINGDLTIGYNASLSPQEVSLVGTGQ